MNTYLCGPGCSCKTGVHESDDGANTLAQAQAKAAEEFEVAPFFPAARCALCKQEKPAHVVATVSTGALCFDCLAEFENAGS